MDKRLVDVVAPLIADREPTILRKPGQCALHHPPVPSELLAALSMPFLAMRLFIPRLLKAPLHSLSSACSFSGRFLGLPLGRLIGSTASMSSSKTIESWTFAPVRITASGIPFRSETRWRFVPFFPLSVGFAAVFGPPFWQGWKPNLVRHAPSRSGRPPRGGREGPGAASPTLPPLATHVSVANNSSPIRSPSLGAASPRECRSLARRRCPLKPPDRRCVVFRLGVLAARGVGALRWFPTSRP